MRKAKPSVDQLVKLVLDNPGLQERLRDDPLQALEETKALMELTSVPYEPLIYRWAVIVLGSLALIAIIGSIILALLGVDIPEVLVALGSAAVGALVGLFAPSPINQEPS